MKIENDNVWINFLLELNTEKIQIIKLYAKYEFDVRKMKKKRLRLEQKNYLFKKRVDIIQQ